MKIRLYRNWYLAGLCLCFVLVAQSLWAQPLAPSQSEIVELIRDPRVDLLVQKQAQINKVAQYKTSSGQYKGFRIMVLNTNNRDLANRTKGELLSRFPEHSVYMAYQAPYFKLKMGDFIKRADAEKLKAQLSAYYRQGVFIIPDIIQLKPGDERRLMEEEGGM